MSDKDNKESQGESPHEDILKELEKAKSDIDLDIPKDNDISSTFKTPIEYESDICQLNTQILNLENAISEIKLKNQELIAENSKLKTASKRLSFAAKGRSASINTSMRQSVNEAAFQFAEVVKEKNELQELNEKMLNMLTEKEIENGELREEYESYQRDMKCQLDDLNERNAELAEELEKYKEEDNDHEIIDQLQNEYSDFRQNMQNELENYEKQIEALRTDNEKLNDQIRKLNSEIQGLELENLQWLNISRQKESNKDDGYDSIMSEIEKLRAQLHNSEENNKLMVEKYKEIIVEKNNEIKQLNVKNTELAEKAEADRTDVTKDNAKLIMAYGRSTKDLNNTKVKLNQMQKENSELTKKVNEYKTLLDKKKEELKQINDSANKVIQTKENIISQYEEKINQITNDKNELIEQNHSLLDQIKGNSKGGTLEDLLDDSKSENHENKLLNEEIKALKDTIQTQANDLVKLTSISKEYEIIKEENEKLKNELKTTNQKYQAKMKDNENETSQLRSSLNIQNKKNLFIKRQSSMVPITTKQDKQLALVKMMKENDKKMFIEQIDKLKLEIAKQKIIYANQVLESDTLIIKYRGIIHRLADACREKGLTINLKI